MLAKITGFYTSFIHFTIQCIASGIKCVELVFRKLSNQYLRGRVEDALRKGGMIINGPNAWDPQVKDEDQFYKRVIENPSLGIGECYVEGHWDCGDLEEFAYRIFYHEVIKEYMNPVNKLIQFLLFKVVNLQTKQRAWDVGERHYDLGKKIKK